MKIIPWRKNIHEIKTKSFFNYTIQSISAYTCSCNQIRSLGLLCTRARLESLGIFCWTELKRQSVLVHSKDSLNSKTRSHRERSINPSIEYQMLVRRLSTSCLCRSCPLITPYGLKSPWRPCLLDAKPVRCAADCSTLDGASPGASASSSLPRLWSDYTRGPSSAG